MPSFFDGDFVYIIVNNKRGAHHNIIATSE